MPQGERGQIELFEDFYTEDNVAETAETRNFGDFIIGGQGNAEVDSGVISLATSPNLGGVGRLTTTDEVDHTLLVGTNIGWDVGLMGTITAECRIQFNNLATKDAFFGFCDIEPNTLSIQTDIIANDGGTTLTLTASDILGFYLSAELTDNADWHTVYNGGGTTGVTDATLLDINDDAVAGEWQILRLELDPNGTVRWYVNEMLVRTVSGAVSTTTDLSFLLGVEAKEAAIEELDCDYLLVRAFRDWTII